MRLATMNHNGVERSALFVPGKGYLDLAHADASIPTRVIEILQHGPTCLARIRELAQSTHGWISPDRVDLMPPIPRPGKIFGVGLNYKDHALEQGAKTPSEPVIFAKFPTCVIGPGANIELPKNSSEVDFEAEMVIAIGATGKHIHKDEALNFVAGYMCGNDVSARDWQQKKDGKQWVLGKSFDTFGPTGPHLVLKEEVPDPHALDITMHVNDELMQSSNTAEMMFQVSDLVAYVSSVVTIEPGDLIFSGTPAGVGFARKPPVWLKSGDRCKVTIAQLGVLHNTCR